MFDESRPLALSSLPSAALRRCEPPTSVRVRSCCPVQVADSMAAWVASFGGLPGLDAPPGAVGGGGGGGVDDFLEDIPLGVGGAGEDGREL